MRWISELKERVHGLIFRSREEADMDEEMRFHLEMEAERLAEEHGLEADEARRQARISFGGMETHREEAREGRKLPVVEDLWRDLHYALRQMVRNPAFTVVVMLTLALGIGANTLMFGALDALFLRPPPEVREPEQIERIYIVRNEGTMSTPEGGGGSYPDYRDLRAGTRTFASVAGQLSPTDMDLGLGERAQQVTGQRVTGGYFPTLGTRPALGRFFGPAEDTIPASYVAVISHGFWQRQFGGDPAAVGREIRLEGEVYTVVGIAPEHFHGIDPERVDVWVPTSTASWGGLMSSRGNTGLELFGRLASGVMPEQAAADASAVFRHAAETAVTPEWLTVDPTPAAFLGPLNEQLGHKRSEAASVALWLAIITGMVLLIACANVANLLLARAARRRREIAVRISLGAGRGRLVRQMLTESMLLALLGGAAGLLLAFLGTDLVRLFPLPPIPSLIDARVLGFALGVSLLTGVVFGLVPALQASGSGLITGLRDGASMADPSRSRTRTVLLVTQVALSLVLLIGAGLLIRSLVESRSVDLGLDIDRLLYVSINLDGAGYDETAQDAFYASALKRLRAQPGVEEAALSLVAPLSGSGMAFGFEVDGITEGPDAREGPYVNPVGPEFFQTTGTALLRGRAFTAADREGSPIVAVVNERMAELYWPDGSALGGCIRIGSSDDGTVPCTEVVGVVESIRHRPLETAVPKYYLPLAQRGAPGTILVRTSGDPQAMIGTVRSAIQRLASDLPFVNVIPATDEIAPELRPFRLGAILSSLFGVLALLLAAVGLYGVVAFTVAQQTREIGVRMALGAGGGDVLRLVVVRAMLVTLAGVGVGLAGALAATRSMEGLLYGVSAFDPATFITVPFLLLIVSLLASYIPARRATRVDPIVALRAD
ncbi:MAG TPA: ABC transporter permease [Longimicrobiaceae bacterium]|nr:ABC transporter permease [Longimicrobiaceae bacterium]